MAERLPRTGDRQARIAEGEERGRLMAERFLARPGLAAVIERLVREGREKDRWLDKVGYAGQAQLQALQLFDHAIGVRPGTVHRVTDYERAARAILLAGHYECARTVSFFGSMVDNMGLLAESPDQYPDLDVEPHHRRWAARHRAWAEADGPGTAALSDGLVRETGRPRLGADGTAYTPAACDGFPGGTRPAVVVRAGARAEIVTFATGEQARTWMARCLIGAAGPLPTTADGPPCRAARENEVIAYMLQHPGHSHVSRLADDGMWTSHLRASLYRAARPRGGRPMEPGDIRLTMEHWMRRSPGWALPMIGWPDPRRAMGYLDRLLATPVTSAQAVAAAHALAPVPEPVPVTAEAAAAARVMPGRAPRAVVPAQRRPVPERGPAPVPLLAPSPRPGPGGRAPAP